MGDTAVSPREHDGPEGPRENKGCDEVHLKHAAEGRGFGGLGRSDEADPCVVDEDVRKAPTSRDQETACAIRASSVIHR